MPTIYFSGSIVPPVAVSFGTYPTVSWRDKQTGETETFTVSSHANIIEVKVELDTFANEDIERHRNRSLDLARAAIDLMNFQNGWGLSLFLDRYTSPDGKTEGLVPGHPELAKYVSYTDAELADVYGMLAREPYLHMAMNDLIAAITWPHLAAINCARAIEGLRLLMFPSENNKRLARFKMQGSLNFDYKYWQFISDLSSGPRHGDRLYNPPEAIEENIKRAWIIMNRYIELTKSGNSRLPLGQFPMLIG